MPGGFHPFHAGHASLYKAAKDAFPDADVYVAATNDTKKRPFPFSIKEKLAKIAGVEPGKFVQVKSPFKADEITRNYDPNKDVLVFVRSEKDKGEQPKPGGTKKDGSPAYFQPYNSRHLQPFSKHGYIAYLPTVEFGPGIRSASEIREMWPTLSVKEKGKLVAQLYPNVLETRHPAKLLANIVKMIDMGMGAGEEISESVNLNESGLGYRNIEKIVSNFLSKAAPSVAHSEFISHRWVTHLDSHPDHLMEILTKIANQDYTLPSWAKSKEELSEQQQGMTEGVADYKWHGSDTDIEWYDAYKDQPIRVKVKNHSGIGSGISGTFPVIKFKKIDATNAELTIKSRNGEMTARVNLDKPETVVTKKYDRVPAMNFYIGSMPATARQAFNLFQHKNKKSDKQGVTESSTLNKLAYDLNMQDMDRKSLAKMLHTAMQELDPKRKAVIYLRYWKDMDLQEIAKELGITDSRVQQLEADALRKLKRLKNKSLTKDMRDYVSLQESVDYLPEK